MTIRVSVFGQMFVVNFTEPVSVGQRFETLLLFPLRCPIRGRHCATILRNIGHRLRRVIIII